MEKTKILYQVYIYEDGEWRKAATLYPTYRSAKKACEECQYAPDEYKIIKIEKEI